MWCNLNFTSSILNLSMENKYSSGISCFLSRRRCYKRWRRKKNRNEYNLLKMEEMKKMVKGKSMTETIEFTCEKMQ